jgi:hypothetical protein
MTIEKKIKSLSADELAELLEKIHDDNIKTSCFIAKVMGVEYCKRHYGCKQCFRDFLREDEDKLLQVLV